MTPKDAEPTLPQSSEQQGDLPFVTKANGMADDLGRQLLDEVPELAGVAIVFMWEFDADGLPGGVVIPREGTFNLSLLDRLLTAMAGFTRNLVGMVSGRVANGKSGKRGTEQSG